MFQKNIELKNRFKIEMANGLKLQILAAVIIVLLLIHNLYLKSELIELINSAKSKQINGKAVSGAHSPPVLIYNRIPKTGSTSFMNVAYELFKQNK